MDSFMTCPGLGTLPEARHVVRETLKAGPVIDDSRTSFALRKVANRRWIRREDLPAPSRDRDHHRRYYQTYHRSRCWSYLRIAGFLPLSRQTIRWFPYQTPSGVGPRIVALRELKCLKPDGSRQNASLCWLQKLIYINNRTRCQAILRKSQ